MEGNTGTGHLGVTCASSSPKKFHRSNKLWEENENGRDILFMNILKDEGLVAGSQESFLFARSLDKTKLGFDKYKFPSQKRSYLACVYKALVVGQEFVLSCLLLTVHRFIVAQSSFIEDRCHNVKIVSEYTNDLCFLFQNNNESGQGIKQVMIILIVSLSLGIILFFSDTQNVAIIHRLTDTVLIAAILRFLSTVLRTLTSSYSSDTVMALSVGGMIVHLFHCDFNYANGVTDDNTAQNHQKKTPSLFRNLQTQNKKLEIKASDKIINSFKRPVFLGGTVSLNCAFFSTTLLASRISANIIAYGFLSFSVIMFSFYPAARHEIAKKYVFHSSSENRTTGVFPLFISPLFIITVIFTFSNMLLLRNDMEKNIFLAVFAAITTITPGFKWWLQRYKENFSGPWNISHTK